MKKEFNLTYAPWKTDLDWVDTRGTIRTTPENYYVADVNFDNTLEFGCIEDCTKDIDQSRVQAWWEKTLQGN